MVAVRLDETALDYVASAMAEAGGLAALIPKSALSGPVAFVAEDTDPVALENLEAGGVMSQAEGVAELSLFVHFLKKRNGRLHTMLFEDPWTSPGDLDYAGPPPQEMTIIGGQISYVYDLAELTQELIWQCRANTISYLKIIYVSVLTVERIRELVEEDAANLLPLLARSIRHIAVNAYDDETWVIAEVDGTER